MRLQYLIEQNIHLNLGSQYLQCVPNKGAGEFVHSMYCMPSHVFVVPHKVLMSREKRHEGHGDVTERVHQVPTE